MNASDDSPAEPEPRNACSLEASAQRVTHADFMEVISENYGRYLKQAYGYLKCKSLAEDAVQEGILTAYNKLQSVREPKALNSWVSRIITRKALDTLRKNKRLPNFYGDVDEAISYNSAGLLIEPLWAEVSNPEQDIMKKENLSRLKQAVEELEDIYRIPFLLKDSEGFSIKEIAELLNIKESNAKVRIHRARTKVKSKLRTYFFPFQNRGGK